MSELQSTSVEKEVMSRTEVQKLINDIKAGKADEFLLRSITSKQLDESIEEIWELFQLITGIDDDDRLREIGEWILRKFCNENGDNLHPSYMYRSRWLNDSKEEREFNKSQSLLETFLKGLMDLKITNDPNGFMREKEREELYIEDSPAIPDDSEQKRGIKRKLIEEEDKENISNSELS